MLHGSAPAGDASASGPRTIAPITTPFSGVSVTATNSDDIAAVGISAGFAGTAAVNISGAVDVVTVNTSAHIGKSAQINCGATCAANVPSPSAEQSVRVAAGNQYYELGIAATLAIGGTAGVGVGVGVHLLTINTDAYIDDAAHVNAAKDVSVVATGKESIVSVVAGASGGQVGVAGTFTVTILNMHTHACLGSWTSAGDTPGCTLPTAGVTVVAGNNVLVSAKDDTKLIQITASLAGGYVGVGVAVGVALMTKDTEAYIGAGSHIDAKALASTGLPAIYTGTITGSGFSTVTCAVVTDPGCFHGLAVQATSGENIFGLSASAGGGFVGVAGGVGVTLLKATTKAFIAGSSRINVDEMATANSRQSVNVSAVDDFKSLTIAGGVAGGFVGVAGGIDIGVANSSVQSYIGNGSIVRAKSNVDVNALSHKNVQTYAVSVGGGFVGVAGSVSVWTVGTAPTTTYQDGVAGPDRGVWSSTEATATRAQDDNHDGIADGDGDDGITEPLVLVPDEKRQYHKGDVVTVGGQKYVAKIERPQFSPTDSAHPNDWQGPTDALAETTDKGDWNASTYYHRGDVVRDTFDGKYYGVRGSADGPCVVSGPASDCATVGTRPTSNSAQWQTATKGGQSAQGSADEVASGEDSDNGAPGFKNVLMGSSAPAEADAWAPSTAYGAGKIVVFNDIHYKAKIAVPSSATLDPSVDTAHWADFENQYRSDSSTNSRVSAGTSRASEGVADKAPGDSVAGGALTPPTVVPDGTFAAINGTVIAGDSVRIRANDKLEVVGLAGAVAGGFVGIGAAILILNIDSKTEAQIGPNSSITAGAGGTDVILVDADLDEDVTAISFAGVGGFVGVGAQVVVMRDTGTQYAHIDDGTLILQAAGGVDVLANGDRDVKTFSILFGTGAFATGASISYIKVEGSTRAEVGDVTIGTGIGSGPVGHFNVKATDHTNAPVLAISVAAGVGVGVSAAMAFTELTGYTRARFGGHGIVGAGGLEISSDGVHDLSALTINVSTGIGAVGVTVARGTNDRDTETFIDPTASISTTGAVVIRATASNTTDIQTPGGSTGGITVTALLAFATVAGATRTTVNGSVTSSTSLIIQSIGDNSAIAESLVVNVSAIGLSGASGVATITSDARIETLIGSTAYLTSSGPVTIEAKTRNQHNRAFADTSLGSLGGVAALSIMVSIATIEGAVRVQLDGHVTTTSAAATPGSPAIAVTADGRNFARANVFVISGSFGFSGNFSLSNSEITSNADVEVLGASTSELSATGLIEISARSNNHSKTRSDVASGGFLSVAIAVPTAKVNGGTTISINGDVTDASGITVQSDSHNFAEIDVLAITIGGIPVAVTVADAQVNSGAVTQTIVGSGASYSAPSGTIQILASSANHADSHATSVAAGGLSIAYMQSLSKVEGETVASFAGDVALTTPKTSALTVQARGQNQATVAADVASVSLTLAVGVNAAKAQVTSAAKTEAKVLSTSEIYVSGAVTVDAGLTGDDHRALDETTVDPDDTVADPHYNLAQANLETFAGGLIAAGVTLSEAKIGGAVRAEMNGAIASSGSVVVTANSHNLATARTFFLAAGLGAIAATHSLAEITTDAKTEALVGSGATVASTGLIDVNAHSHNDTTVSASGAGGGLVSGVAALPTATNSGATTARFGGNATSGSGLAVTTTSDNNAIVETEVVNVGAFTGKDISNKARVESAAVTEAGVTGSATLGSGAVTISATSGDDASATSKGVSGGVLDIGTTLADAKAFGKTTAYIGQGANIHAGSVSINASGTTTTFASVKSTNIGGFSAGLVRSEADSGGFVEAYIGQQAGSASTLVTTVDVGGGAITITADGDLSAEAQAHGSTVAIVALGAMLPHADTSGVTRAYVRDYVDLDAGTLTVSAGTSGDKATYHSKATSFVFSVSVGGLSGVTPRADTTGKIEAFLGAPAEIAGVHTLATQTHTTGAIVVRAYSDLHAEALAEGTAIGGVSAAIQNATAIAGGTTRAFVGGGGDVSAGIGGLSIIANSTLLADATTKAVTVGFFSITGAQATANVSSKTETYLGKSEDDLTPGTIEVDLAGATTMTATSSGTANATARGAGGGLAAINILNPTADASSVTRTYIGRDTDLTATSVTGTASSTTATDSLASVTAIGGIAATDVHVQSDLHAVTTAFIGTNSDVTATGAVSLSATSDNTSTAHTNAFSASLIGISLYDLDANTTSYTAAFVGNTSHVTAGSLALSATATDRPVITFDFFGIAGISGGSTTLDAIDSSTVETYIGPGATSSGSSGDPTPVTATGAGGIDMSATSHAVLDARMELFTLALLGDVGFSRVTARSDATVRSFIGDYAQVNSGPGALHLAAVSDPNVQAIGKGFSGAFGFSGSTSSAIAQANGTVKAYTKDHATLSGNSATFEANYTPSGNKVKARIELGGIALIGSVAGGTATATSSPTVETYVATNTTVNFTSTFTLTAGASNSADAFAAADTLALIISLGAAQATATANGSVTAHMDGDVVNGSSAGAGSLVIQATQVSTASAGSQASSGGLIGGTGNSATATSSPTLVAAYLAGSSTTVTSGNLRIAAEARPEADANTSGTAFGLLAGVGGSTSTATASPTVNAYIGNGAIVHVGGNIEIEATVDKQTTGADSPTYIIESASAANDTLHVNDHGLQNGDVIEYDSSNQNPTSCVENTPINGLTPTDCVTDGGESFIVRRAYNVLAYDANNIRLGSQFDGQDCTTNPDAASCVNTVNDTILFGKAHNFLTGDRVRYTGSGASTIGGLALAGATFYVLVIDERTIRLVATQSVQTTASDFVKSFPVSSVSGSTVTLLGHGLTNGTQVTYHSPQPLEFSAGQVDTPNCTPFLFFPCTPNGNPGSDPEVNTPDFSDTAGTDSLFFVDPITGAVMAHGFSSGDRVLYNVQSGDKLGGTPIGGLTDGRVYRVIKINDSTIQLKNNAVLTKQVNFVRRGGSFGDQIIRTDGLSWDTDGFDGGQTLLITGSPINNGTWHIDDTTGATLTLTERGMVTGSQVTTGYIFDRVTHTCSPTPCTPAPDQYFIQRTDGAAFLDFTNFLSGGFTISGTSSNNKHFTVKVGGAGTVNIEVNESVVDEAPTATAQNPVTGTFDEPFIVLTPKKASITTSITIGGTAAATTIQRGSGTWENLVVAVGAKFSVSAAQSATDDQKTNDGTYIVTGINGAQTIITARRCADSSCGATSSTGIFPSSYTATLNVTSVAPYVLSSASVAFERHVPGDTITRTAGWGATPFTHGTQLTLTGAGANNSSYTVDTVVGNTITLVEHDVVKATRLSTNVTFDLVSYTCTPVAPALTSTPPADDYFINRTGTTPTNLKAWANETTLIVGSTFTVSGSASNNGTFTIIAILVNRLQVAEAVADEVGVTATFVTANLTKTFTEVNPHHPGNDVHSLQRVSDVPLPYTNMGGGSLVDGGKYYVVNAADTTGDGINDTFGLALTPGGTALAFDTTGLRAGAIHSVTPQVDLTGTGIGADHTLRIDVGADYTKPLGGPFQHITGPGGLPLGTTLSGSGNGQTKAESTGSGGGFVGVRDNTANATTSPTVSAHIGEGGSGLITAEGNVTITATSKTDASARSKNGAGGFVGISDADARVTATHQTLAYIAANQRLVAGGNLSIFASSDIAGTGDADSHSGGFVGAADADSRVHVNYTTKASVMGSADVLVDGTAKVWTDARTDAYSNAHASGIGAGGDGQSNAEAYADTGLSQAEILSGASLVAREVSFKAGLSLLRLKAHGEAYGAGFYAEGEDDSNVGGNIDANVVLGSDVLVTGLEGVDLISSISGVNTRAESFARATGLFGWVSADGNNYTDIDGKVDGAAGGPLRTTPVSGAVVTAGPRPVDTGDILAEPSESDHLALYINTKLGSVDQSRSAHVSRRALAGGSSHGGDHQSADDTTDFNSDVLILSGRSPYLFIAANGSMIKVEVTASINVGLNRVDVGDIVNPGAGDVVVRSKNVGGSGGTWVFRDTLQRVTIINESSYDLFLNDIHVLDSSQPLVWLSQDDPGTASVTLGFDIRRDQAPTIIEIRNHTSSNVLFNGTVENPIGITFIENTGGSVRSTNARDVAVSSYTSLVRTNILRIDVAAGNVGQDATHRLNIDIVDAPSVPRGTTFRTGRVSPITNAIYLGFENQFFTGELVRYNASDTFAELTDGAYYFVLVQNDGISIKLANTATPSTPIVLSIPSSALLAMHTLTPFTRFSVDAPNGAAFLDVEAHRRDSGVGTFVVTVDDITTKFDADLLLQVSISDPGAAGSSNGILVKYATGPDAGVTRYTHFLADGVGGGDINAGFGLGGSEMYVTSTYDFRQLDSSGNRTLPGVTSTNGNIIVTSVRTATSAPFTNVVAIFEGSSVGTVGTGAAKHIDVLTNGFITIYEQSGDLRAGLIKSTAKDVILYAPARIVDATGDTSPAADADVTGANITMCAATSRPSGLETRTADDAGCAADARRAARLRHLRDVHERRLPHRDRLRHDRAHGRYEGRQLAGHARRLDRRRAQRWGGGQHGAVALQRAGEQRLARRERRQRGHGARHAGLDRERPQDRLRPPRLEHRRDRGRPIHLSDRDARRAQPPHRAGARRVAHGQHPPDRPRDRGRRRRREPGRREPEPAGWILLRVGDNITLGNTAPIALSISDPAGNTQVLAGRWIDIYGDYGDLDAGYGSVETLHGTITPGTLTTPCADAIDTVGTARSCNYTRIFGNGDADTFELAQTLLGGRTRVYGSNTPTPFLAPPPAFNSTAPLCAAGRTCDDFFYVKQLQTMNVAAGHTLTLDGQEANDTYFIYTSGSRGNSRNYVINVLDGADTNTGAAIPAGNDCDAAVRLTPPATATDGDDLFLLRRTSYIGAPDQTPSELADRSAFVALLHTTLAIAAPSGSTTLCPITGGCTTPAFDVERVNYDTSINGRLKVYGLGGNDYFAVDDNSAITTLDGGLGDDKFQIGQIYGTKRDSLPSTADGGAYALGNTSGGSLSSQDVFGSIATTRGWLSAGASQPLIAKGGSGDDEFTVYSNQATLRLEGEDDNDLFVVRAFALAEIYDVTTGTLGVCATNVNSPNCQIKWISAEDQIAMPRLTSGFSTAAESDIRTGAGNNQVMYNVNAPVSIDGGNGFDKVVILGTEYADHIVITYKAIYGAGLSVTYANVEVLEVDALEGDDTIDVLSTQPNVLTRVIGGLGNDTINVAGDVAGDVVSRNIEGTSGTINHIVKSADQMYSGLLADGIDLSVARPTQGQVVVEETAGFSAVREGGCFSLTDLTCLRALDSYNIHLATAPTQNVYVTVSATMTPQEEQSNGDTFLIATGGTPASPSAFSRIITVNGNPMVVVPTRALVLTFTPGNYATPQNVYLFAVNDVRPEGDRVVISAESVISRDPGFDHATVRNVEVTVADNDLAGIVTTQRDAASEPDNTSIVLEGAATACGGGYCGVDDVVDVTLAKAPTPDVAGGSTTTIVRVTPADQRICVSSPTVGERSGPSHPERAQRLRRAGPAQHDPRLHDPRVVRGDRLQASAVRELPGPAGPQQGRRDVDRRRDGWRVPARVRRSHARAVRLDLRHDRHG